MLYHDELLLWATVRSLSWKVESNRLERRGEEQARPSRAHGAVASPLPFELASTSAAYLFDSFYSTSLLFLRCQGDPRKLRYQAQKEKRSQQSPIPLPRPLLRL